MIVIITRSSIYPRDRENKPNDDHVACTTCSCLTLFDTNHNFLRTCEPMKIANLSRKISCFNHPKINHSRYFYYYPSITFFFFFNNNNNNNEKSMIKETLC